MTPCSTWLFCYNPADAPEVRMNHDDICMICHWRCPSRRGLLGLLLLLGQLFEVPQLKKYFHVAHVRISAVQVSDIQRHLDAAGIDYRDCYEREQLLERLRSNEGRLAGPLAQQLQHSQRQQPMQPSSLSALTAGQLAAQNQLFMDEQYVVNLFQARSVIVSSVAAESSLLKLDVTTRALCGK